MLVPIYALAPRAETLLIIQATLIGAAVIPLFLFSRNRLGPYQAVSIAAMYVFYAPLHGGNLYDFHYPPLGIGFGSGSPIWSMWVSTDGPSFPCS